jgi:multidrug efflux pump subunit AcrA (membrane-fusion protein)
MEHTDKNPFDNYDKDSKATYASNKHLIRQAVIVLAAVALLAFLIFSSKKAGVKTDPARKPDGGSIARVVEGLNPQAGQAKASITINGRLVAYEKTELYAEVSGMLLETGKPFREGVVFNQNEVLMRIEDREARLQVIAQRSALQASITQFMPDMKIDFPESFDAWSNYLRGFSPEKTLTPFPEPQSDRERNFLAAKNIYNQYYTIKSTEERLAKYTLVAPFTGMITLSNINTGTFIRAGQKLGDLMNTSRYELEAPIRVRDLKFVNLGATVSLSSPDIAGTWQGKIQRIGQSIDAQTQSVMLYVTVSGQNLKENMYLSGEIASGIVDDAVEVPRKLVVNDQQLWTVQDSVLALVPIQLIRYNENTALVRGLPAGTTVLKETFAGMYEGQKVRLAR